MLDSPTPLRRDAAQSRSAAAPGPLPRGTTRMRRLGVLAANALTILSLTFIMAWLLGRDGWTGIEIAMLIAYTITLPWLSIGFWNAVVGFAILARSRNPIATICPALAPDPAAPSKPIVARTAIIMTVRNEDPKTAFRRMRAIFADIDRAGVLDKFDFHILSDTDDPMIAAREERLVHLWQVEAGGRGRIAYRRRTSNEGYKAGNIDEFCERCGDEYTFFLPLDADSFMSANAILRLVHAMQDNPEIGILQGLVVGTPSQSFFTRTFQFGMRHGMRAYTVGSAWWQGDCGPYWGHNALIRTAPFREHCKLPVLPGNGPLSGYILSHDQVEAVLMRRAGYDVRVLAAEDESWEDNPPSLPDFIRRELRWCQGNMQYWQLLTMPDTPFLSRIQLLLAILMYVSPVAWMVFISLGAIQIATKSQMITDPGSVGIALFTTIITMSLAPKLMGLASTLAQPRERKRYGGALRTIAGGIVEIVFSALAAPVVGFAIAVFVLGLVFGRKLEWQTQQRELTHISWRQAFATFWPQTLFGCILTAIFIAQAPQILPWAAPVILGLLLSIPFTVLTTAAGPGRLSRTIGLCDIPEDRNPPLALQRLGDTPETNDIPVPQGGIKQAS